MHDVGNSLEVPENALSVLDHLASEVGANFATVLVAEDGRLEIAYPSTAPVPCEPEIRKALLHAPPCVHGDAGLASFLRSATAACASSFLLFSRKRPRRAVTIAFGYSDPLPRHEAIPAQISDTLHLVAFAVWSHRETLRLQAELSLVNQRFGQRKTVERAKGLLQAEKGITEQEAYEWLRKMSRQRRITLADAAEHLLRSARSP